MLKRLPQDQLETESKLMLAASINQHNWKLVEFSDDKFGIDGDVQIIKGYQYTGKSFRFQLKAGKSYISSESEEIVKLKIERKYVLHWMKMPEPVVVFYYHPSKTLYWKVVQPYFSKFPGELKKETGNVLVVMDKQHDVLDDLAFSDLELVADRNFTYRKVIYSDESHEQMLTNRFVVLELPQICCVAPTEYSDRRQITPFLEHFFAFTVKQSSNDGSRHSLWTFSDLSDGSNVLQRYCRHEEMESWKTRDMPPTLFKELLNNLIYINCLQRDLLSDKRRYYFNPKVLKTQESNTFNYPSLKGRSTDRTKIYVQKTGGRLEYKYHAVRLQLIQDCGNWYLEMEPDWYFTFPYDKQATRQDIGRRITKEKASTLNGEYRYLVHFWKQYLSNNGVSIVFPCDNLTGKQRLVVSAQYQTLISDYLLFNDYDGPRQVETAD
jgi:hypothetical protein